MLNITGVWLAEKMGKNVKNAESIILVQQQVMELHVKLAEI